MSGTSDMSDTSDTSDLSYGDALAWIYSFSDTERTGQFVRDREDNLPRERALLAALGNPQSAYGVTHVAGTKGKGSTAAMVAAILRAAGVRAGLYSSPDLHTFRERIRVDGGVASEAEGARLPALGARGLERGGASGAFCAAGGAQLLRAGPAGAPDCAYTYRVGEGDSAGQTFDLTTPSGEYRAVALALLGAHQVENAAAAIAIAEQLRAAGLPIDEAATRQGLRDLRWPARLQVVARAPWVVVDGAHTADSFAKLFVALRRHFRFTRLILVLGLMADKDLEGIVREIASAGVAQVVTTAVAHPRAAPPERLSALLQEHAPGIALTTTLARNDAMAEALPLAQPGGPLCGAGSPYPAGQAPRWGAAPPRA